jgi:hypothetical protein
MLDPEAARENWQRLLKVWLTLTNDKRDALLAIAEPLQKLGPNAIGIVQATAERLAVGADQYKEDFTGDRDWMIESLSEMLDNNAYLMMALKQLKSARDGADK